MHPGGPHVYNINPEFFSPSSAAGRTGLAYLARGVPCLPSRSLAHLPISPPRYYHSLLPPSVRPLNPAHLTRPSPPLPVPPRSTMPVHEVERKFVVQAHLLTRFRANTLRRPFAALTALGRSAFRDTYFDTPSHELTHHALWLRRRCSFPHPPLDLLYPKTTTTTTTKAPPIGKYLSAKWELKCKLSPSTTTGAPSSSTASSSSAPPAAADGFTQAAYREITSASEIQQLLEQRFGLSFPPSPSPPPSALQVLADLITYREAFRVDGEFEVVLDSTDFGHAVGEVEVLANDVPAAEAKISRFVERYDEFFGGGGGKEEPRGKLSAYFDRFGMKPKDVPDLRALLEHRDGP